MGFFNGYKMKKVLMVCLGNICRSPMAEGILRHKAEEKGLHLEIDSCGTSNYHKGEAPDKRARAIMKSKGISIDDLKARQLRSEDFQNFDHIFVMDHSNYSNALEIASMKEHQDKIRLLLSLNSSSPIEEVPDPYFGGDEGFEHVFRLLDDACEEFIKDL